MCLKKNVVEASWSKGSRRSEYDSQHNIDSHYNGAEITPRNIVLSLVKVVQAPSTPIIFKDTAGFAVRRAFFPKSRVPPAPSEKQLLVHFTTTTKRVVRRNIFIAYSYSHLASLRQCLSPQNPLLQWLRLRSELGFLPSSKYLPPKTYDEFLITDALSDLRLIKEFEAELFDPQADGPEEDESQTESTSARCLPSHENVGKGEDEDNGAHVDDFSDVGPEVDCDGDGDVCSDQDEVLTDDDDDQTARSAGSATRTQAQGTNVVEYSEEEEEEEEEDDDEDDEGTAGSEDADERECDAESGEADDEDDMMDVEMAEDDC
ncbi:hypothetical protein M427DRAFT_504034 [Gonapodya prolifera JEL478]|uniref:Uncharacterized protein n=1 Tax=Gonapodya prolifera (strain JEL478) TaxID=1344416 RepID=A0A139A564_GONPJ|nr:hypothetical protein M427DRAFT_504034 [Gonapodya prolifera JEL478]|eukprot:KXS11778.1 hypothetical protein M427DRAFT_504034 [Gonapodya prolifera JEL478]